MFKKTVKDETTMLKNIIEGEKKEALVFQVLLLNNDSSDEVEVEVAKHVDFQRVQEHLKQGGSVFITSKKSQKLPLPKLKNAYRNKDKPRKFMALYFSHV